MVEGSIMLGNPCACRLIYSSLQVDWRAFAYIVYVVNTYARVSIRKLQARVKVKSDVTN